MNLQDIMLLNIGIVAILVMVFFAGKKTAIRSPSRLKMQGSNSDVIDVKEAKKIPSARVMFNYNGHSWDAYEVFGLAKSSSMDEIKKAFSLAMSKSQPSSHEFLKTALETILKDMKDRGYRP